MTGDERRILLVEFLNRDRYSQYRSEMFPFVRGYAEESGLPMRWVVFGFDPATLPDGPFRMTLPADEEAALLAAVRAFAPTHVLLNEELAAPLDRRFREAAGATRGAVKVDTYLVGGGPAFVRVPELEWWLDLAPRPERTPEAEAAFLRSPHLVDEVTPSYACELVGPLARTVKPFTFLLGGPHCLYAAPLARNPDYEGVDLSAAHSQLGCAFCGETGDRRYPHRTAPVELALKQLRAARDTLPAERASGEFALWGAAAVMRFRDVFEAILAEGFPPTHLYLALRFDELRRKAHHVDALLPRLRAAGHSLRIYNMGVENFSPTENRRLNKGIDRDDVETVCASIERWEREFPGTFRFWETGGFGFILFTPWTRVEDLRLNLSAAERLRIEPSSFFFSARIQLMPGRAITALAERDGLTLPPGAPTELTGFDSGCIMSAHEHEKPWRFHHPEVAALYGVFVRVRQALAEGVAPEVRPDDPQLERVRQLCARLPEEDRSPYRILSEALDVAEAAARADAPAARGAATVAAIVDGLEARLAAALGAPDAESLAPEAAAAATEPPDEERETPADRRRRASLEVWLREALAALAGHPKRLLQGFEPDAVAARATGAGWGELVVTLRRDRERLRVHILPRDVAPHGFCTTPHFTVMHDADTPVDTDDKRRTLDIVARGFERYVAARERAGGAA